MRYFWKNKPNIRVLAIVIATIFVCLLSVVAGARIAGPNAIASPESAISVVATDSGAYVEVGLNFRSGAGNFQSAGAVLTYNPAILSPVQWEKDSATGKEPVVPITPAAAGRGEWSDAAVLEAKGASAVTGKTAMTFQEELADGAGVAGYLYLAAEMTRQGKLNQPLPAEAQPLMTEGEDPVQQTTVSGLPILQADKVKNPVEQAVVVRFQVNTNGDGALYSIDEVFAAVDLLRDSDEGATIGNGILRNSPVYDKDGFVYYAENEALDTLGVDSPVAVSMLRVLSGKTANTGNASADNFGSLVFYDWDDTLLGAVTVGKDAGAEDIQKAMDDFADTLKASADKEADFDEKVNQADGYYSSVVDGVDKGAAYPLTYKKAYRFEGVWLDAQSDAFECYREEDDSYYETKLVNNQLNLPNHGLLADYTTEERPDAAKITSELQSKGSVMLKAAYKAEKNINVGANATNDYRYVNGAPKFNRYGASTNDNAGTYSIKFNIIRENANGKGVARIRTPGIWVRIYPDVANSTERQPIYELVSLEGKDTEAVEVVVSKRSLSAEYNIIETYGVSNWTGQNFLSARTTQSKNTGGVKGTDGFIKWGTVGFINEQGMLQNQMQAMTPPQNNTGWTAQVNWQAFADAGFKKKDGTNFTKAADANAVKPLILEALKRENRELSFDEIQSIISQ